MEKLFLLKNKNNDQISGLVAVLASIPNIEITEKVIEKVNVLFERVTNTEESNSIVKALSSIPSHELVDFIKIVGW